MRHSCRGAPCATHCPPAATQCHLPGCTDDAAWEGWARKLDPFTQKPSGMTMLIPVCEGHKGLLIGAQAGTSSS